MISEQIFLCNSSFLAGSRYSETCFRPNFLVTFDDLHSLKVPYFRGVVVVVLGVGGRDGNHARGDTDLQDGDVRRSVMCMCVEMG